MRTDHYRDRLMESNCLVTKLSNYLALSNKDVDLLLKLQSEEADYPKKVTVREAGNETAELYVVKHGWLYSSTTLPDGRRQVLQLHYPGDIVGIPDVAFDYSTVNLETITDVCLCPFRKNRLDEVFINSSRLTALLFSFGMVDYMVLLDRIRAISRMNAEERIAHFLLEVSSRLRITNKNQSNHIDMPLTQEIIGDAVGLTNVYVSKSMRKLEDQGLIARDKRTIEIKDHNSLKEMVDFHDRYFKLDTSWFPESKIP